MVATLCTTMKFIDLFCGIGGFHQALSNFGGQCVFACDIDADCRNAYEENYHIAPASDITKIDVNDIPSFDVLCVGFPCQPFSKAGLQQGFDDERGNLFFNICAIVKRHQPKYLILENVRNLSTHDGGNTWTTIYQHIDRLGYNTYETPLILNALNFNVPQNRERVVILCKRKDLGELPHSPIIPSKTKALEKLTNHIRTIIVEQTDKPVLDAKMKCVEQVWDGFVKRLIANQIAMPKFPIWTDWWDNKIANGDAFYAKYTGWIDKNRSFYAENKSVLEPWLVSSRSKSLWTGAVRKFEWQAGDLVAGDGMNTVLWSARGSGIRVKRCDYAPTLVAMAMIPVYGPLGRKLTPREILRLQSFPDNFKFNNDKKILKQVGNSVNVVMIERCARFLMLDEPLILST